MARYYKRYRKKRRTGYRKKRYYRRRYYKRRYSTRAPRRWVRGYGSYSGVEEQPFVQRASDGWGIEFDGEAIRKGFKNLFDNKIVNTAAAIADIPTSGLASSALKVLNRGIDYGINWGQTGQPGNFTKKDKKALKKFGTSMGNAFGENFTNAAKESWNDFTSEDGWGGQIQNYAKEKIENASESGVRNFLKLHHKYNQWKPDWRGIKNYYMPDFKPKIYTRLGPEYDIDQYERFWKDREIQQQIKQNKWEKQYRHEFDPVYMNKYK